MLLFYVNVCTLLYPRRLVVLRVIPGCDLSQCLASSGISPSSGMWILGEFGWDYRPSEETLHFRPYPIMACHRFISVDVGGYGGSGGHVMSNWERILASKIFSEVVCGGLNLQTNCYIQDSYCGFIHRSTTGEAQVTFQMAKIQIYFHFILMWLLPDKGFYIRHSVYYGKYVAWVTGEDCRLVSWVVVEIAMAREWVR